MTNTIQPPSKTNKFELKGSWQLFCSCAAAVWWLLKAAVECSLVWSSPLVIGLMFGILIGISRSPVLGLLLTGVLGLATAIASGVLAAKKGIMADPQFVRGAERRLCMMALGVVAGLSMGILCRESEWLYQPPAKRLAKMGFSDSQIRRILDAMATEYSGDYRSLFKECLDLGFTHGQAQAIVDRHAASIVLAPRRFEVADKAITLLDKDRSRNPQFSPWTDKKGTPWFESFVEALGGLKDIEATDEKAIKRKKEIEDQFKSEIDHIRGLLKEMGSNEINDPTSIFSRYQSFFEELHVIPKDKTLESHFEDNLKSKAGELTNDIKKK